MRTRALFFVAFVLCLFALPALAGEPAAEAIVAESRQDRGFLVLGAVLLVVYGGASVRRAGTARVPE